ncbi:MAG: hypothetical protein A2355_02565 [Spirochaetes bacterium RIFOXYB1_FULL_32_8]|nr:MAG: hypothetical protein A2Y29_01500 [Spirochaetes bacterium GWE2_31_10]OHD74105.1 MAG: hypothetical protein A2355_02565 [Spirochaetes bacterium RIFOXYB1_FULL_32_8]HBD94636.1 hypothetical protein [Spirochaetia bacterium]HBI39248.1 hypothetical protein [Spirochaetia bacterium]
MSLKRDIGAKIKDLREKMNYTQEQLAEIVQIDIGFLSGVENGRRNITLDTLDKILTALNQNILTDLLKYDSQVLEDREQYISIISKAVQQMDIETLKVLSRIFK